LSISQTFFEQFFQTKVFSTSFSLLTIWLYILWQKNIGAKATRKMIMKLTTLVSLTNFFGAAFFLQKCFRQLFVPIVWHCNFLAKEYLRKSCQ